MHLQNFQISFLGEKKKVNVVHNSSTEMQVVLSQSSTVNPTLHAGFVVDAEVHGSDA